VFCTTDGDITGYGTATKTLDGSVITAFHVIDGCSSLTFTQGSPLDPVVLGTALGPFDAVQPLEGRDLAIVGEISWTEAGLALAGLDPIWDFTAELGELTLTVGMPAFFFDAQFAPGFITSPTLENSLEYFGRTIEWSEAFVTDAATAGGASGGPVFDSDGRWVGIHVGASTDTALELSIQIPLRR
jgi:S1-C subfamily serine protease